MHKLEYHQLALIWSCHSERKQVREWKPAYKQPSKQVAGILVCASIFGIIAMALYTDYHGSFKETAAKEMGIETSSLDDILKLTYGWAYGFGWFATVMAFISTILAFAIGSICPSLCGTKV